MTRIRDADKTGFEAMVAECGSIIRKVARNYCWDAHLREDLAQEILVELWRAWPRYDAARSVGAWVYRVALNVAIDYVRSSTRRRPTQELDTEVGDGTSLEEQVDEAITMERAIKSIEPFDRAILLLFLDGHSQSDIAAVVGTTEANVSTRLHRIKARLGAHFKEGGQ